MRIIRIIAVMLVCAACFSMFLCGCTPDPVDPPTDPVTDPTTDPNPDGGDDEDDDNKGGLDDPVPSIDAKTIANINLMRDVLDSLVRAIGMTSKAYIDADDSFFWIAMYYQCSNFADEHPLVHTVDGENKYRVPSSVMYEFGSACFVNLTELPVIPDSMQMFAYDSIWDAYVYDGGAKLGYCTEIESMKKLSDGYELKVNCIASDRTITDSYIVTIVANPNYNDTYRYAFSVSSMVSIAL